MKARWSRCLCLLALTLFGIPSYAHARGGFFEDALPGLTGLLMIIVVLGIIFLFLREFFCWYFKINERVALQKEIRDSLKHSVNISSFERQKNSGKQVNPPTPSLTAEEIYDKGECPGCGVKIEKEQMWCDACGENFERYR